MEINFLFNESTTAIFYTDANGVIIKANPAYCALFALSEIELSGQDFTIQYSNLDIDAKNKLIKDYKEFYLNNKNDTSEKTIFIKSCESKDVEIARKFIQFHNQPSIVVHFITEIKCNKRTSKILDDLQFFLDQPAVVSITDTDGIIINVNQNFCKISGFERKDIIGQNHRIVNSGFHSKDFFKQMWDQISSGKIWQGEIKNARKDGTFYWVYSYIIPVFDDQKKPYRYISFRNEITERKVAEERLAASEEKYRLLYENAPIGIAIVDPEATILDCNHYLLKMLGYEKSEMVGKKSHSFLHKEFIEYKATALKKLFMGKIKRFYIEEKCKNKEGAYIWTGCYSNAISNEKGQIAYRLDFITDIENRKKSEEELLKLDQSKNAILNIVAHDLRSPLVGITNLIRLMLRTEVSEENKKYLELMENSGTHSMSILQDLLDMAQLEQELQSLNKEPTELNSFIRECIKFHQFQSKEKSIQIHFTSKVEKIFQDINRDKMKRVFSNLISNAIKFSHEGGIVEIQLYRETRKTVIMVKDFGIGIPEEMKSIIFEKFSHARRLGTKGEHSIGLGMSIAKEIIDKHEGKIRIESEENKGTTVYIKL